MKTLRRPRVTILRAMTIVAAVALLLGWAVAERRKRLAAVEAEWIRATALVERAELSRKLRLMSGGVGPGNPTIQGEAGSPTGPLPPPGGIDAPTRRVWDFEADEPGKIARGFSPEVGAWKVAIDGGNHVLAQEAKNDDDTFNAALVDGTNEKDLDLSVRLKAVSGENDRGGGLVWRAKDAKNYYIARYNPLEDNVRVYKVEDGKRTQLDHADAPGDGSWHTLRITMTGREILGYLDGKKLLVAEDSTFPDAGKIGLWSKSDAQTYFDDLTVSGSGR